MQLVVTAERCKTGQGGGKGKAPTSEWGSKVEGVGWRLQYVSHTSHRQESVFSHLHLYSPCTDRHLDTLIMVWQIDLSGKCIVITGGNRVSRARGSGPHRDPPRPARGCCAAPTSPSYVTVVLRGASMPMR
jgi:hypothetical protein